jgi:hypothetical protein
MYGRGRLRNDRLEEREPRCARPVERAALGPPDELIVAVVRLAVGEVAAANGPVPEPTNDLLVRLPQPWSRLPSYPNSSTSTGFLQVRRHWSIIFPMS